MSNERLWLGGDRVEVKRLVSGTEVYFPANVINEPSLRKNLVWIEHESIRIKEYVTPTHLRPSPPRELNPTFKSGDEVDVFSVNEGCWIKGKITSVNIDSKYTVKFNGVNRPELEIDYVNLRHHCEHVDGSWIRPQSIGLKRIKLKIKLRRRDLYEKGDIVEVKEGGEEGWYCGRIVSSIDDGSKYVVEHCDESKVVESKSIRPVPPLEFSSVVCYEPGDEVDVWFNKRWWIGRVSKVVEKGYKYLVYFVSTGEEPMVLHFNLRPRRDWINGQWIKSSKPTKPPLKKLKRCEREERLFSDGMKVEVRSDEPGYEGAWYTAKIVNYLREERYIVEYQTLRTEDQRELLKEEAKGSDIRPIPPPRVIQRGCGYELDEYVDAWFNDGWWSGQVYMRNENYTRYVVYFKSTDEKLEFDCNDLRPCQVWINGKWTLA